MSKYLNFFLIGDGNQSKRIQKILAKKKIKFFIFSPSKKSEKKIIDNLKSYNYFDAYFILSPNSTHYFYLKNLPKNKYIFCEKPPVNSIEEYKLIKKMNLSKVFFNFNFRFSKISEILNQMKKLDLGNLVYASIISGYGLAFKKNFFNNWRSKKKNTPKGIFEILTIHWLDLINFHFSVKKYFKPNLFKFSKFGKSYDNSLIRILLKNNSYVDIFNSYTSPLVKKCNFIFTNGTIEIDEKGAEIRYPAENFDKKGFFIKPKLKKKIKLSNDNDYLKSLEKSVDYFVSKVRGKKNFLKKEIISSLKVTSEMLK